MLTEPANIKFKNAQRPGESFDLIRLEDLYSRTNLDHSPFEFHRVEFFIILLIEEGTGSHVIDFTEHPFSPGTVITIRQNQIHRFVRNQKARGSMLLFTSEFIWGYLEHQEALRSIQLFNEMLGSPKVQLSEEERKGIHSLIDQMNQEYFSVKDEYSFGVLRSQLHILIARLFRIKSIGKESSFHKKYLKEFIQLQELVEENGMTHKKVSDYASMMGLSTKTLNTVTKEIIQQTAKEFIDGICLTQIKRLLLNTDLSVKEIAYESGFDEPTNFFKYVRRLSGMTPEQIRASEA